MRKTYQVITDRITKLLEEGTVPWHQTWGGQELWPKSLVSGKHYRGINVFLLSTAGYESPYWLTFKQAKDRGGFIKKGEQGSPCVYWNWKKMEDPVTQDTKKIPFSKYYTVFNVTQCENIEYPTPTPQSNKISPIQTCENIVSEMPDPPMIENHRRQPAYYPLKDTVFMPSRKSFDDSESYYSTLFHELIHSTGHRERLNRPGIVNKKEFGSHDYSREELIAEMGATFLCGQTGIERKVIDNSASYINHWLKRLRQNNKFVVVAGSQAQKAVDYVLNVKYDKTNDR